MFGINVGICSANCVYNVVFSVILIFTCLQSKPVSAQSRCITPKGHEGTCVPIDRCAALFDVVNTLKEKKDVNTWNIQADFLRKSKCDVTVDHFIRVCCPNEHKNLHLVTNQNCGDSEVPRVHNGKVAVPFEFPWMALIAYRIENKIGYQCGGSLINSRYVLTAAHCIKNRYPVVGVRLGEHDIKRPRDCFEANKKCPQVQLQLLMASHTLPTTFEAVRFQMYNNVQVMKDIPVEETKYHEKYSDKVNDIGLIRLARPADLKKINVIPICLPVTPALRLFSLISKTPTVAGWGTTEDVNFSDVLRKATLTVIDNGRCQDLFSTSFVRAQHISPAMKEKFCAYGPAGEDSCTGDSGGPLMYLTRYGRSQRYVLYGIVSYGSKECNGRAPSVFTAVDAYLEWILDRLRP